MAASTSRRNYSTTPGWIGQRVQVQWTDLHVHVLTPSAANCCASTCGRRILGVLGLAKQYGPVAEDDAAKTALDL